MPLRSHIAAIAPPRPLAVLAALGAISFLAAAPSSSPASAARAVLESKCLLCHGEARMSGLDLRSRQAMLVGGKRGPALAPGDSASSLLYQLVSGQDELRMPPGKDSLAAAEIAALRDWIDADAPWERAEPIAAEPSWWSFRKPVRPPVPQPLNRDWGRTPIDAFILAELEAQRLEPAPAADRRTLVRRATFDLHGLPPTPEEVDAFLADDAPNAWERLIDRLLESPRYGERWGRSWLDLVRYADTSGFETDHFYTTAWRYRDYVIKAFNEDKPYDVFVREQIAADELWSTNMDLEGTDKLPAEKERNVRRRIGTSLFTLGAFPIEYTFYGEQYRAEWQAEAVDLIGSAFLGMTIECARCHDHKFDPISQRDYYALSALFAGSVEREIPLVNLFVVQGSTRSFPLDEQARILKRMAKRASKSERDELLRKLGEAYLRAGDGHATAKVLGHEEVVPDTHILAKGDFKQKGDKVEPGFPAAILRGDPIREPQDVLFVPRRRKALAEWLTSPDHPLLGRVMVNRIWQGHFGAGIVRSPNDFGRQGDAPTHPELLDWLAVELADQGWSLKRMHKLIMLSSVYRSSSVASRPAEKDPDNLYLSRMSRRRLDADGIRDSILAVSGALNLEMGGVGVIPPLTSEEILAARMPHLWPAHPDPEQHGRRSVYLQVKRSMALPMFQIFDAPNNATSCARREVSTVAPQALALMNSRFSVEQSERFAERLRELAGDDPSKAVGAAWRLALGRSPTADERRIAEDYLARSSLPGLGLLLFNMSEFLYVD